jgi:hypothetical protein
MDKNYLIKLLKPYWKKRKELHQRLASEERKLERDMNTDLSDKLNVNVGFQYNSSGECLGIGASIFDDHQKFPLITDSELGESE